MSIQARPYKDCTDESLFHEYKKNASLEIKQEFVYRYLYIVENSARKMKNVYLGFTETEDIINEGVIEIMNAVDRFDPDRNVKFSTYIYTRIRGMIIDLARKQDWVPRKYRMAAGSIERASEELMMSLGREPKDEEIAEALSMDVGFVSDVRSKQALFAVLSLDSFIDGCGSWQTTGQVRSENDIEQPEQRLMEAELIEILSDAISSLKKRDQIILSLYYVDELNMSEIAEVLDLSESRISQLHKEIIEKVTNFIKNRYNRG